MEVDRIRKVADMIEAHPEHFDIHSWIRGPGVSDVRGPLSGVIAGLDLFACHTAACFGGWACNLWGAEVDPSDSVDVNAARILGLPDDGVDLFFRYDLDSPRRAAMYLRKIADDYEAAGA